MNTTTNLGLKMPEYSDQADIQDINDNMEILDGKMGAVGNTSVQEQIDDVVQEIGSTALPTTAQTLTGAIAEHEEDLGTKADKVTGATTGHFAGFDENGNLVDSGKQASDFVDVDDYADDVIDLRNEKANASISPIINNQLADEIKVLENCAENMGIGLEIPINPVQDLHGYANPWVGGAGKNILPCLLSSIKSGNTNGTWNDNEYSLYGITFAFTVNSEGYVTSITVNGTATANATVRVYADNTGLPADSYIASGCPSGGTSNTYYLRLYNVNSSSGGTAKFEYGNGVSVDNTYTIKRINVSVDSGNTVSGLVFKPMVRLATVTDATFAPYTNICPISGYTGVSITRTGRNLANPVDARPANIIQSTTGNMVGNGSNTAYVAFIPVKPFAKYTLSATNIHQRESGNTSSAYVNVVEYSDADRTTYLRRIVNSDSSDPSYTFTISGDAKYIRFSVGVGATDVQLEIGENVSDFTPYTGCNEYNITFPTEAGTVYGGTLTINKDGSGTLVVDKGIFLIDDRSVIFAEDNTNPAFRVQYGGRKTGNVVYNTKCSHFSYYGTGTNSGLMSGTANGQYGIQTTTTWIMFKDDSIAKNPTYSTSEEKISAFTTKYSDMKLYVDLSSAVEYTLTPQQITSLFGITTIWNSIGTFSVSYHEDPKVYVDDTAGIAGSIEKSNSTEAEVMSFSDGADNLPMEVAVAINPVQDLHGYANPWVGGANVNLANFVQDKGINSSGNISDSTGRIATVDPITIDSNKSYIVKHFTESGKTIKFIYAVYNDSTLVRRVGSVASGTTLNTSDGNKLYVCAYEDLTGGSTTIEEAKAMVVLSTGTVTEYTPYANICPIGGWDSVKISAPNKNLNSGIEAGSINTSDGTNNDSGSNVYRIRDKIKIKAGGTYTISGIKTATGTIRLFYYDSNKEYLSNETASAVNNAITRTFGSTVSYIRFQGGSSVVDADAHIQIEAGSVATEYEPFRCFNISIPQTTYGGTLTINKDGSGKLIVDRAVVTINGTETFIDVTSANVFYVTKSEIGLLDVSTENDYCNMFRPVAAAGSSSMSDGDVARLSTSNNRLHIKSNIFAGYTASQLATYFSNNNLEFCGKLASPVNVSFTAQQIRSLFAENNLWADSGNVLNVVYYADTKMYIDNLFNSILPATGVSF